MNFKPVIIKRDNFDTVHDVVTGYLSETKADSKECNQALLLMEELCSCFFEQDAEEIEARVVRRFDEVSILLSYKGYEYNPVTEENIFDPEDEDYYRRLIIRANREKLGCSYKHGKNIVRITVHTGLSKNVYYSIFAMILGVVAGLIMRSFLSENITALVNTNIFAVVKTIFLNSLKMMVAPVIFFSIAGSIRNLTDLSDVGKMGTRIVSLYMTTTVIAIFIGLFLGNLLSLGSFAVSSVQSTSSLAGKTFDISVRDIILGIAPSDLVSPIADGNMLQIIFVSIIFGIAANILGDSIKLIGDFLDQMNALCLKVVLLLVRFIPVAAFCSMASMMLTSGVESLLIVLRILIGVILGGILMLAVYSLFILIFGKLSPIPFLKKSVSFAATPFSLASSNAAMPFTMNFCTEKLGISKKVAAFSVPLGATLNMDGHCVYLAISTLLLMKLYSVPVTGAALTTIIISIFVLSIGAPGVTGSGIICLSTITVTLGLPVECIGLVVGIDQIAGMLRTVFNVMGDIAATTAIASSLKLVDKDAYAVK